MHNTLAPTGHFGHPRVPTVFAVVRGATRVVYALHFHFARLQGMKCAQGRNEGTEGWADRERIGPGLSQRCVRQDGCGLPIHVREPYPVPTGHSGIVGLLPQWAWGMDQGRVGKGD